MKKIIIGAVLVLAAILMVPTIGEAALGDQTLKQGMVHEDVKELQLEINKTISHDSQIDGVFGPLTKAAVKEFQKKEQITVDGIVGPETFAAFGLHSNGHSSEASSNNN